MENMDKDIQAEMDLRTMREAHKIKSDSKRMSACKKKAMEEMEMMAQIASLKDHVKGKKKDEPSVFRGLAKSKGLTSPMGMGLGMSIVGD